jgi:hypothetical protein
MGHAAVEHLIRYLDGVASEHETAGLERHLKHCVECQELKQELQVFVTQLRDDSQYEPPADIVRWGIDLFQPVVQPQGSAVRRIIASLIFDTFDQPLLAGVRRLAVPPRQLLFRAGAVDVDVRIESMEANERINLSGQVLSNGTKFFDNTPVQLESRGTVRYRTVTNAVGEFTFDEVPKDTYHLSVDLPEGQVTVFCVHRGNA